LFTISGVTTLDTGVTPDHLQVTATRPDGSVVAFEPRLRIDTPGEADYYRHGGILPYVLRSLITRG
jgi:aconitate hydratase